MRHRTFALITSVALLLAVYPDLVLGQLHEGDFALTFPDSERLVIEPGVLVGHFQDFGGFFFTDAPGIDTLPGTFAANTSITFLVTQPVGKWTGSTFETATETIEITFSVLSVTTSTTGATQGFALTADSAGEFHRHYGFTLNAPASTGMYLLPMQLYLTNDMSTMSDPFYFLFNQNDSLANQQAALQYVQNVMIPEPTSLVLLLGAGCVLLGRRRTRMPAVTEHANT